MRAQLETLITFDRLLTPKHVKLPCFDHPFHFHPEWEITYLSASGGTCVIGDHIGSFRAGELYVLGSKLPHVFRNTPQPGEMAEAEVLHISAAAMKGPLAGIDELKDFASLLQQSQAGLIFDRKTSLRAGGMLRRIRRSGGVRALAAFFELADLLLQAPPPRMLASSGYSSNPGLPGPIERACNYIITGFAERLSHRETARKVNMSPAAFSRLFRRATRKSYTEFLTEVRLGHASRMLLESDRTVAEIAFASGFENLSNFNRRFRRYYQYSPVEYRKAAAAKGRQHVICSGL